MFFYNLKRNLTLNPLIEIKTMIMIKSKIKSGI